MADEMNLTSAAAAFARQAKLEAKVETVLRWALREFLADVEAMARRDLTYLSPAAVGEAWTYRMSGEALGTRLPLEAATYVSEMQAMADTPIQTYDTAMAVLTASNERVWSRQLTFDVLAEALSSDTGGMILTAAAPKRDSRRGKAMRAAFDQALGQRDGQSWITVTKRDARTAVTGLDGIMATQEMARRSVPKKRWVARHDKLTRSTHVAADGQTVPVPGRFTVGGVLMAHPGDRSAPPGETINCRCVTIGVG